MEHTKSVRCTCPSASRSTLSGFTSRWMMPCPWMYLKAHPSSDIQNLTASSVNVFLEMWNRRSPPLMRSTTKYLSVSAWLETPRQVRLHVFDVLEAVPQVADEWVVHMLEHSSFAYDIADAFRAYDWWAGVSLSPTSTPTELLGSVPPSSFRMYLRAKDRPVSFLSTIRTLPKAPRPTTLRRRKWFRFTARQPRAV